jgi:phage repressor protein C with HTH and peptisase S24 domain
MGTENGFSGEVLRDFRKAHKLTQEELAKVLDIDRTYLARLEMGHKTPSSRLQADIKEALARFADDHRLEQRQSGPPMIRDHAYGLRIRSRDIPVVSWAAAGAAKDYQDLATQIDETVASHVTDPNAFAVILEGDSMEPEFHPGDRVVVAPNVEARTGDAALVKLTDGRVLFKWFHRTGPEGKMIRLKSENEHYAPMEFSGADFLFAYPALEFKRLMRR